MGLNNSSHEQKTFLSIVGGKLAKRVAEGTTGAVEREIENDNGKKTIWELLYSDLDAKIESLEVKEGGKYGDSLEINCVDGMDKFTISLNITSREAKGFMNCLPNIVLNDYVKIEPYNYVRKKDNRKMIGLGVKQNNKNVPYFYTAENGLPSVPEGQEVDKDEFKILMQQQVIFLKKKTKAYIAEMFANKVVNAQTVEPEEVLAEGIDPLPF